MAAAVFARPYSSKRNWTALAGSLIPDAFIYGLVVWAWASGIPLRTLFSDIYFSQGPQLLSAIFNSIPLFAVLFSLGLLLLRTPYVFWAILLIVFSGSALLHLAGDIFVHADDGHSHFWPFTMWKFESPVSYWDDRYFAAYFRPVECAIVFISLYVLWNRFNSLWVRSIVGLSALLYGYFAYGALVDIING